MHLLARVRYLLGVPSQSQGVRPSLVTVLLVLLLIVAWRLTTYPDPIIAEEPETTIEIAAVEETPAQHEEEEFTLEVAATDETIARHEANHAANHNEVIERELAALREIIEHQNRKIRELTERLARLGHKAITSDATNKQLDRDAYLQALQQQLSYDQYQLAQKRIEGSNKESPAIKRLEEKIADTTRLIKQHQEKLAGGAKTYATYLTTAKPDTLAAATLGHARRKLRDAEKRFEAHQREFEMQRRMIDVQLHKLNDRIKQDDHNHEVTTREDEAELNEEIADHERESDLEMARMEIHIKRQQLKHKREQRRAENEYSEFSKQIEHLEGKAKDDAIRRIHELQLVLETADEELKLMQREMGLEMEIRQAKAERQRNQLRRQWRAEHKTAGRDDRAGLRERHEQLANQSSEHERESRVVRARLQHQIAELRAELEKLGKQSKPTDRR